MSESLQRPIPVEENNYWHAHLAHLKERQPGMLLGLLRAGLLRSSLERVVNQAGLAKLHLLEKGLPEDQAEELVYADIVAPSEVPLPEKDPLSHEERRELNDLLREFQEEP